MSRSQPHGMTDSQIREQTFYIFFGVAIGIGIVFGLAIHFMERFGAQIFGFDQPKPPRHEAAIGHSAKSYRAAREMKKQKLDEELRKAAQSRLLATEPLLGVTKKGRDPRRPLTSPTSPKQRAGLLSTTILEEEDDSDKDF